VTINSEQTETKPRRGPGYLVNPYEIAFRGFAGSSHSDFVDKLSENFGALEISVVDIDEAPGILREQPLLDADAVFINSRVDLDTTKVVLASMASDTDTNVIAYVGTSVVNENPKLQAGIPYFSVENTLGLSGLLTTHFDAVAKGTPLYGLVLAGGKSTRMNRDKASLSYHGKPQVEHCCELLSKYCEKVFVSNRAEQTGEPAQQIAPQIHDRFTGFGPMGGILSALKAHPKAAWLALACDLPYVDDEALQALLRGRDPHKLATAFISENDGFPEPLCAVYEPKSIFRMLHFLGLGYHCPRKVLINSDSNVLKQPAAHVMTNVNSPEEYAEAQRVLAKEGRVTT